MQNLVNDFLKQKNFAVIGSFRNESKYAYQIFKKLVGKGYQVYPVNPNIESVAGHKCYKTLSDIPVAIDVVDFVTPPAVTENILKECLNKGIKKAWLQPGAESDQAIKFCQENNIQVVYNACIMLKNL
ncbi:MAG: CoA-binding protein [Candidatus Omnitrophota bacterium]|nr:MAG: CoA-binding protein [Candidatus Omnitrophota bacterium]